MWSLDRKRQTRKPNRFIRGTDMVRQQVLWLLVAVILVVLINVPLLFQDNVPAGRYILILLSFPLIPVGVTIAVLRHGLYDVRIVVLRLIVYALAEEERIRLRRELHDSLGPLLTGAAFKAVGIALADARLASVRLTTDDGTLTLKMIITDDGSSTAAWSPGLGLSSIQLRASEVGGAFEAGPTDQGGRVTAVLPLRAGS
jgi:signal transduction histidine kinase